MERIKHNSSTKLAALYADLASEITAGLETSLQNIDVALRSADHEALLRRVKSELLNARNLSVLLSNSLRPEPKAIVREAPEAHNVTPLRRAAE